MIDFARKPARIQAISGETTGLQIHDTEHTTRKRTTQNLPLSGLSFNPLRQCASGCEWNP